MKEKSVQLLNHMFDLYFSIIVLSIVIGTDKFIMNKYGQMYTK